MRQIKGTGLRGMNLTELGEISPASTRVERKMLLRTIQDIETASQVPVLLGLGVRKCHSHICTRLCVAEPVGYRRIAPST